MAASGAVSGVGDQAGEEPPRSSVTSAVTGTPGRKAVESGIAVDNGQVNANRKFTG